MEQKLINANVQAEKLSNYILDKKKTFLEVLERGDNDFLFAMLMDYFDEQKPIFDEERVHKKMWMESEEVCGDSMINAERAMEIIYEELSGGCM